MAEAAAVAHQRRRKLTEHEYDEEQGEEEDDGLGAWRPNSRHTADAWVGWSSLVASQSDKRLLKSRSFLDDPRRFERYEHTNTRDAAAFGTSFPRSQTVSVEARPAGSGRSMGRVRSLSRAHDVRTEQEGDASGGQVSEAAEVAGAPQNVTVPGMKLSSQSAHCVPAAKAEILPGLLPSAAHLEPIHEQGQDEDQALVGGNRDAVSGFKGDGRAAMLARKVAVAAAGLCVGLAAIPSEGVSTKIDAEPTTAGDGNGEEEAAKGGGGEGQQPMSVDGGPDAIGIKLGLDTQGPAACLHESPSLCGQVRKGCEGAGTCGGGGAGASAHACTRLCVPFSSSSLPDSESLEEEELKDIDDEVLQEVFWRVRKAKVQLENYCNVLMFFIFVAIYFAMMYLQADSTNGYEVAHGHEPLLPPGFAADQPNSFNSREEFYTWLNDSIIQVYWKDPQCGNGVCEAPLEYPVFGSQGCEADCGKMQNLTTIFISINTNFDTDEARVASSWNLCMTSPVNLCWFTSYQDFPDLLSHISLSLDVPDGDWAVWLNAPRGGVRGTVNSPITGLSRIAVSGTQQMKLLTSWGQCMSEELSPISRCRGVCSTIVTCISSMACGKHASQQQLSGVFVECANQCKAEPEPLLVYENATCSKVLRELPELVPMQNCSKELLRNSQKKELLFPRVDFCVRALPPERWWLAVLQQFDDAVWAAVLSLLQLTAATDRATEDWDLQQLAQWQVQLPFRFGGAGLLSARDRAPLAFACATGSLLHALVSDFGSFLPSTRTLEFLTPLWRRVEEELPVQVFRAFPSLDGLQQGPAPRLYQQLSEVWYASRRERWVEEAGTAALRHCACPVRCGPSTGCCRRAQSRCWATASRGSALWLQATPSGEDDRTFLPAADFRLHAQLWLGLPLAHLEQVRVHPLEPAAVTRREKEGGAIWRVHNAIRDELADVCREHRLPVRVEPTDVLPLPGGRGYLRPDLTLVDHDLGITWVLDVTTVDAQGQRATGPGRALEAAEEEKVERYRAAPRRGHHLRPLAWETLGGLGEEFWVFLARLAKICLSRGTRQCSAETLALWAQRAVSILAQRASIAGIRAQCAAIRLYVSTHARASAPFTGEVAPIARQGRVRSLLTLSALCGVEPTFWEA